jgi:hypothetical protein
MRKYFIQSKNKQPEKKTMKRQQQNGKTLQAYSQIKENSNQPRQNHYYFNFHLKTKQTHTNYAIRAANRQRMSKATL